MDPSCSAPAVPAGLTVQVCFPGARAAVLDNLNRQREEGRLCDLSIQVQGQVFRAHRCVLAASSPYFHDQVLLKNVTTVSLPSVMDPVAFESVLSSAYTGQLSIVHDDIVNYVTVASFLQMWHIVDKCTEILKRPRPPAEVSAAEASVAPPGSASRQQSPSSSDCLYLEREGRRKERKPDALPPLATWRRPQQFPRWGRPRPSSAQHLADSQLDAIPGCSDADYGGCEEAWTSNQSKGGHLSHDGPGHGTRHHAGVAGGEALKQKVRFQQRGGAPPSAEKNGENEDADETREKRRSEKREIEADEGVGEEAGQQKEGYAPLGHCGLHPEGAAAGQSSAKSSSEEKVQRSLVGSEPAPVLSGVPADGVPGASCSGSGRLQWGTGAWSQPEPRPQDGEGGRKDQEEEEEEEEEEEDVDFECFPDGAFSRDTYDEIEDGTGQVSQRPLVPPSPDFSLTGSEVTWASTSLPASSNRNPSPSSAAAFAPPPPPPPPPSSPPTPSSSSSVSLAGAPYTGKVHFCHCGKAYTLKSMRDRHVKMQHLNLRPFGCPVCTKSFKMKHHLTKHLKTHGGLRPYECLLCGKKVVWRDSFLRHQARCERLASSSSGNNNNNNNNSSSSSSVTPAADMDDGYSYGFEDGDAFLAAGGQVKVEEAEFHSGMEDGMGGLLGSVSEIVDQLRTPSQSLDGGAQGFKEEASESFSGS